MTPRWKMRLEQLDRAFGHLRFAAEWLGTPAAAEREGEWRMMDQDALVQRFEFTHELAWKVMKDYMTHQGAETIRGSRDAVREAFAAGLLQDGEVWMKMIETRNKTSHIYSAPELEVIVGDIREQFTPAIAQFIETMKYEAQRTD